MFFFQLKKLFDYPLLHFEGFSKILINPSKEKQEFEKKFSSNVKPSATT